jgi:hypothetical protein
MDTLRVRVAQQWHALPPRGDPASKELLAKIRAHIEHGM